MAPQPGAGVVGPAGVSGDRQRLGVRVAGLAEVLPPADDRVDGELGGLAGDADADPPLVGGEVIDAVGDRVPELLVLEVGPRTSTGRPLGSNSRPTALKSPTSSRFLASTLITGSPAAIASLTVSLMCAKLRIAIRVLSTLPGLLVRLQAVPLGLQQPQHRAIDDLMPHLRGPRRASRHSSTSTATATPDPPSDRIDHPIQRLRQPRLPLQDPGRPSPRPTHPLRIKSSSASNSPSPRLTVPSEIPVARATAAIPPRPCDRASAAAHRRRDRSVNNPFISPYRSRMASSSITQPSSTPPPTTLY